MRAKDDGGSGLDAATDVPTASADDLPRPLFGLWSTLLVVALLVGPYAVYTVSGEEPYPAVILPGGASAAVIDSGEVTFEVRSFIGYTPTGEPSYLDVTELLDPIPPSHSGALARSKFGQDETARRRILVDLWIRTGDIHVPRHVPGEADRAAARAWVNDKLTQAGLVPDRLEVWNERVVVDYATGEELRRERIDEVVIFDR